MGASIRYIIKKVLKEDEERVRSQEWEDSDIDGIMANIELGNDAIERAFSDVGIEIDLDKVTEFGSIDRIKQAGVFDFSFILKEPIPEFFGDNVKVTLKVAYNNESTSDTLVLNTEKGGEIIFDRKSLVKEVPIYLLYMP